jgi:hypothetical protein
VRIGFGHRARLGIDRAILIAGVSVLLGCAEAHDCNGTCDASARSDAAISDSGDGAPVVMDSGPFCGALLPQLVAGGWDQCTTYCPSGLRCDAPFRCDLPRFDCHARWAFCSGGQVVVSTDGVVCDAGTSGPPLFDAGGVHSCDQAWTAVGPHPACSGSGCDAGIACDGFTRCWGCPYWLSCNARGLLSIDMTLLPCDAGPPLDAATHDASVDAPTDE